MRILSALQDSWSLTVVLCVMKWLFLLSQEGSLRFAKLQKPCNTEPWKMGKYFIHEYSFFYIWSWVLRSTFQTGEWCFLDNSMFILSLFSVCPYLVSHVYLLQADQLSHDSLIKRAASLVTDSSTTLLSQATLALIDAITNYSKVSFLLVVSNIWLTNWLTSWVTNLIPKNETTV